MAWKWYEVKREIFRWGDWNLTYDTKDTGRNEIGMEEPLLAGRSSQKGKIMRLTGPDLGWKFPPRIFPFEGCGKYLRCSKYPRTVEAEYSFSLSNILTYSPTLWVQMPEQIMWNKEWMFLFKRFSTLSINTLWKIKQDNPFKNEEERMLLQYMEKVCFCPMSQLLGHLDLRLSNNSS